MAANHHLRQVLLAVNLAAMPYPEAYIPDAETLFDESGRLTSDGDAPVPADLHGSVRRVGRPVPNAALKPEPLDGRDRPLDT